jgi:hypothetical protein
VARTIKVVDGKTVYPLAHPVELAGEIITEVTIGRIKGKHMRKLPADPKEYTLGTIMDLAAKAMGETSVLLDEMDSEDVQGVCEIVGERFSGGQATGETD